MVCSHAFGGCAVLPAQWDKELKSPETSVDVLLYPQWSVLDLHGDLDLFKSHRSGLNPFCKLF